MSASVACARCGASTPLPDDLLQSTFPCRACGEVLQTAALAGGAAVSADQVVGFANEVAGQPFDPERLRDAPRFHEENPDHLDRPCLRCGANLAVPLALTEKEVRCGACERTFPITAYLSDAERLERDMERQVRGNDALKRLVAEGLACSQCGGHNPVPDDHQVQLTCAFCGATLRLADYVDEGALARRRLARGVFALHDELAARQEQAERRGRWIGVAVVASLALLALAGVALSVAGAAVGGLVRTLGG